ncbi:MAG: hypothetical protein H6Q66_1159 [Firmicutes bacterium]|nr:hypothetical protein [Bacillota bacterium]
MKEIEKQIQEWPYLTTLPEKIGGFTLVREAESSKAQVHIFTYANSDRHLFFSVAYDSNTDDFLCKVIIGLNEYYDVNFIAADLPGLETVLNSKMGKLLGGLERFDPKQLGSIFQEKKILDWTYVAQLPQEVAEFHLFIRPDAPIKVLNGSFVIIDYSDFATESHLVICYNVFRDDFYGEIHLRRLPQMSGLFDAKTLSELAEQLKSHLVPVLKEMRIQLDAGNGEK